MRNVKPRLGAAALAGLAILAGAAAATSQGRPKGTVLRERLNPPGLSRPRGYSHVVTARGGKQVFVAGQVALDSAGGVIGQGDLKVQADKAFDNLRVALSAAGATPQDVVKLNTYVVGYKAQDLAVIRDARSRALGDSAVPASTLVGVQALAREELLIEVDAVAVVP